MITAYLRNQPQVSSPNTDDQKDLSAPSGTKIGTIAQIFQARCPFPNAIPDQIYYNHESFERRFKALLAEVPLRTQFEAAARVLNSQLPQESSTIDMQTAIDLKILRRAPDSEDDRRLADELDRTFTKIGKCFFDYRLANPTSEIRLISSRQNAAKAFCEDELQSALSSLFQDLAQFEEHMLGFFSDKPFEMDNRFRTLRFTAGGDEINNRLNQYSPVVSVSAALKTTEAALSALLKTVTLGTLSIYAVSLTGILGESPKRIFEDFTQRTVVTSGVLNWIVQGLGSPALIVSTAVATVATTITSIPTTLGYFFANVRVEGYVQNKLVTVASYVRTMEKIYNVLISRPELTEHLEHFGKLQAFFTNPDLQYLLYLLKSSTFDSKAGFCFCRGPVIIVWDKLTDSKVKKEFEKAFLALAEVEVALSVARLITESNKKAKRFSFAKYQNIPNQRPNICVKGLTNPVLPFDPKASRDDLATNSANFLLTAPNGKGKSTKLAALGYLATLQGLGIAPAKEATLTAFDLVVTSKGITDSHKKSLHQTYELFCERVLQTLKNHPQKKVLVILDEAFTTTRKEVGVTVIKKYLQSFQKQQNALVLVASHFKELIGELHGYTSYTIEERTRKLITGASFGSNAFQVAEEMQVSKGLLRKATQLRKEFGK